MINKNCYILYILYIVILQYINTNAHTIHSLFIRFKNVQAKKKKQEEMNKEPGVRDGSI